MHVTLEKFGYPNSCLQETEHWCLLLRPVQMTCASMVIVYKDPNAASLGDISPQGMTEFTELCRGLEATVKHTFGAQKFNYLALMMVDPHVHFHVLPRYDAPVVFEDHTFEDIDWPDPPDITRNACDDTRILLRLKTKLRDAATT